MASDLLHIKDGYFFELPKVVWPSRRKSADDFPDWFVRNDPDYQLKEADYLIGKLEAMGVDHAALVGLKDQWLQWKDSSPDNYGWPLDDYLDQRLEEVGADANAWANSKNIKAEDPVKAYLAENPSAGMLWYYELKHDTRLNDKWLDLRAEVNTNSFVQQYNDTAGKQWSKEKIAEYNEAMAGKVMIPQLPGVQLRNAYQKESGFAISRFMIIEVIVAILLIWIFSWLARRVQTGNRQRASCGIYWNRWSAGFESQVVVPAMGEHDADRFMPFFYSLFFFIFACNLMGMIPFIGAPTSAWGTTVSLAIIVFLLGMIMGIKQFGVAGYLKNISPSLGLPWYMAIVLVPMLWIIEAASLIIKHVVLSVRLLLNMSAGHLVMLGILGIGINIESVQALSTGAWSAVAAISVVGTLLLSFLELFVAGLQAFVFTFLAALLIGSSIHHH